MNVADIYNGLKGELQEIESDLTSAVFTEDQTLYDSSLHLLHSGGKRLRPIFVLLSGRYGDYSFAKLKDLAVVLELIHMATLVHDDVIDDADKRRGSPTVKAQWSEQVAMSTGEFLFAKALQLMANVAVPGSQQILAKAIYHMCLGEIRQIHDQYNVNVTLRQYLRRIKRKTSLLIAVSCQLGAMISQANKAVIMSLYQYGYYVGMAFQLIDDILDFSSTESVLGKPAGSDLIQGNVTLPFLYAQDVATGLEHEKLQQFLLSRGKDVALDDVLDIVRHSGGLEFSLQLSQKYLRKASQAIRPLPQVEASEALEIVAQYVVNRSF